MEPFAVLASHPRDIPKASEFTTDMLAWLVDAERVQRVEPEASSADTSVTLSLPLAKPADTDSPSTIAIVTLGTATPFTIALAVERLELLGALYASCITPTAHPASHGLTEADLNLVNDLLATRTTSAKDRLFVDAVGKHYQLPTFAIARLGKTSVQSLVFNNVGKPHAASLTAAAARTAAECALDDFRSNTIALPAVHQNGDWLVCFVDNGSQPAIALIASKDPSGEISQTATTEILAALPAKFGSFLIYNRTGLARPDGLAAVARRLANWKVATGVLALVALIGLIPFPDRVEAPVKVSSEVRRVVTAPFDAILQSVSAKIDQSVKADKTVLAKLSTNEIDVDIARNEAKRAASLTDMAVAQSEFDPARVQRARLTADIAEAELAKLRYRKSLALIKPQVSGVVTEAEIEKRVGSMVSRGQKLFEIADPHQLQVEIFVPDNKITSVAIGQNGEFALVARPGETQQLIVERVHPVAETIGTRTVFRVDARIQGPRKSTLRPGMEGIARLENGSASLGWLWIRDAVNVIRNYFWI